MIIISWPPSRVLFKLELSRSIIRLPRAFSARKRRLATELPKLVIRFVEIPHGGPAGFYHVLERPQSWVFFRTRTVNCPLSNPNCPLSNPNCHLSNPNYPFSNPNYPFSNPNFHLSNSNCPLLNPNCPLSNSNCPFSNPNCPLLNPNYLFRIRTALFPILKGKIAGQTLPAHFSHVCRREGGPGGAAPSVRGVRGMTSPSRP